MNIIVLAGGYSSERDVSLVSGSNVVYALRCKGHNVLLLDPYISVDSCSSFQELYKKYAKEDYNYAISKTKPDLYELKRNFGNGNVLIGKNILTSCKLADVVFIALHGSFGENGQIQAALDLNDVCYTGSDYTGCMLSMDKIIAKEIMKIYGIKTPKGKEIYIDNLDFEELIKIPELKSVPYVVKPCNGGSSLGVTIVKTKKDIYNAIKYVKEYEHKIIVEEYIVGREFTVGVLDGDALPVIEICTSNGFFDYVNKYQHGFANELCPAPISEEMSTKMQNIALKVHYALRLGDYSRTDFIMTEKNEIYCLEVNSLPGLTPSSLMPKEAMAIGLNYEELCEKIVTLAMERKRIKWTTLSRQIF